MSDDGEKNWTQYYVEQCEIAARAEVLRDVERLTLGSWRISENRLRELLNELRRKYGVKVEP